MTIAWSMIAAACLTLAAAHGLVWWWRRPAGAQACFALSAVATAAFALGELWMMRATTTAEFGTAMRWAHVPAWLLVLSLVGFVRFYLHAGRTWLAWAVGVVRTLSLVLNFVLTPNLNYREISALRPISFLGESVSVATGEPNPWMLVGNASLLLLVAFVVDASITAWRRGDRRQAVVVGGSIVFVAVAGTSQAILVFWGLIAMPITVSIFYLGLLMAMGYELSREVCRASQLTTELRESEGRMQMAAEAAGLAVWRWDIRKDSIWISADRRALYGVKLEENISLERFFDTVHPEDREGVRQAVERALAGESNYSAEYRMVLPDGTTRWIGARGRVEFDGYQRAQQMLGVSIDNTVLKQAELEAEQQRRELAHLARVTTLGELSGSLAHELNQPLAIILSNAQAALRLEAQTPPNLAEVREILADIVGEARRAGDVIQRLRALVQPGEASMQPLDVNEVVEEVLRLMRADLIGRGVTLTRALAAGLPQVCGDRSQLQHVLLNLVLNACEAMAVLPPGDRKLHLVTELYGGEVRLSVTDTGVGLPAEAGRIFDPFFTTKPHGLGMGLAICRSIAKAHRGRLWVEANLGRGVTFHLSLLGPVGKIE